MNPFYTVDRDYDQALCDFDSEIDYYESRAAELEQVIKSLTSRYWLEYMRSGRIDDLDLDAEELEFMAHQRSGASFRTIVLSVVRQMVEATPNDYLPDFIIGANYRSIQ